MRPFPMHAHANGPSHEPPPPPPPPPLHTSPLAALLAAPAPSLASVTFLNVDNGATVSSPVHLELAVKGYDVWPASGCPAQPLRLAADHIACTPMRRHGAAWVLLGSRRIHVLLT
jgi:hypothetical protein